DIVLLSPVTGMPLTGGGAILVAAGNVKVDHCSFVSNVADGGFLAPTIPLGSVGGAIFSLGGASAMSVDPSDFSNNQASGSFVIGPSTKVGSIAAGGAIAAALGAFTSVDHTSFTGNGAVGLLLGLGGAVAADSGSIFKVDHSAFTGNTAADIL